MSRRITQTTFDDTVKENVSSFGMTVDEAVADTVTQFEAQGVDLSNLVKDGGGMGEIFEDPSTVVQC
jgi:armadillo repeat-containing protein 6